MSGYRPAYTVEEDRAILQFIIDNKSFYELRGTACWKSLEQLGTINRTWQSMKEHFIKHIYFKLHHSSLQLTEEEIEAIRAGFKDTSKAKIRSAPRKPNLSASSSSRTSNKRAVDLCNVSDSSDEN